MRSSFSPRTKRAPAVRAIEPVGVDDALEGGELGHARRLSERGLEVLEREQPAARVEADADRVEAHLRRPRPVEP